MKRILSLLPLLALAAACADQPAALSPDAGPAMAAASANGGYIVALRDGADPRSVAAVMGIRPRFVYTTALHGFAATLNAGQLNALRHNASVAYVEADAQAQLLTTQFGATWGIDRTDQHDLPLSTTYTYGYTGKGVLVYVLDTGIRKGHTQFGGRASYIPNGASGDFVGDGHGSAEDCHGHGTHVAGTIGSTTYGIAKQVTLYAGRVVGCAGGGSSSMAIAGMDWIARNGKPGVVNMSLGYGDMASVRAAAGRLVDAGFFVAASAGNGYLGTPQDACLQSPGGHPAVMTVGSTTSKDVESSFSNYGRCVDILAPGSDILSLGIGSDSATAIRSGTSMATPHVAGVAAQYLQVFGPALPATVASYILSIATPNRIQMHSLSVKFGTPNLLLYTQL
jgi:subtilisin family serine protease